MSKRPPDKIRLRNPHTGERESTLELDGLPKAVIERQAYESATEPGPYYEDPFHMLRDLGFDPMESAFLVCWVVENRALREMPDLLHCSQREVNRLRTSVQERIGKLAASNLRMPRDFLKFGREI